MRTVSVPLKIIWLGEYACLYDKKALGQTLLGLNLRLIEDQKAPALVEPIASFVERFWDVMQMNFPGFDRGVIPSFRVESDAPFGIGLGTSASLAVALAEYCYPFLQRNWQSQIAKIIAQMENQQHGKASGVDQFLVCQDPGVYAFQAGAGHKLVEAFPFPFVIINTFGGTSTAQMVQQVSQFYELNRSKGFTIMRKLGHLAYDLLKGLEEREFSKIYQDLETATDLLNDLGVVDAKVYDFCRYLRSFKIAAKITGAGGVDGGSGAVLVCYEDPEAYSLIRGLIDKYDFELIYKANKTENGYQ